jgi:hypothetical protein
MSNLHARCASANIDRAVAEFLSSSQLKRVAVAIWPTTALPLGTGQQAARPEADERADGATILMFAHAHEFRPEP